MKITSDSKYLFFGLSVQNSIELWDACQMKKIKTITDSSLKCECLEITRDNRFLISTSTSNSIKIWDISQRQWLADVQGHIRKVYLLYMTQHNNHLISVSEDRTAIVWNINECINRIDDFKVETRIACIEDTADYIIFQGENNNISIRSVQNWQILQSLSGHTNEISYLKLFREEKFLISGSYDSTIRIWNVSRFIEVACLPSSNFLISCIRVTKLEDFLVVCSISSNTIKIWDIDEKTEYANLINSNYIKSIELICDDKFIVSCLDDGKLVLWSFEERNQIAVFVDYSRPLKILKYLSDDCIILMGSYDGIVSYYNVKNLIDPKSEISTHSDCLYKTMTSYSIRNRLNHENNIAKKLFYEMTIFPMQINCLHCYCWENDFDSLSTALNHNVPIIRDLNSATPLTYAIIKDARQCIEKLLNFISNIQDESLSILYLRAIRDDIPKLFEKNIKSLVPFLSCLLRKESTSFSKPKRSLPIAVFSPTTELRTSKMIFLPENLNKPQQKIKKNSSYDQFVWCSRVWICIKYCIKYCIRRILDWLYSIFVEYKQVQFWKSNFGWNFSPGWNDSIMLLKAIQKWDGYEIYSTEFVQTLIELKWNSLSKIILVISLCFWANIALMILAIFTKNKEYVWAVLAFNIGFALYEFNQFWHEKISYWFNCGNWLDIIRFIFCFWWCYMETNDKSVYWVTYFAVLTNFATGLLYFRAFRMYRFYVRLILIAIRDAIPFLIILIYSILGFSIIYASTDESASITSAWKITYELEAGNFDNSDYSFLQYLYFTFAVLINVVVLLNLLVSVLGKSFDRLKEVSREIDLKEMLSIIIEIETTYVWRSKKIKGRLQYIQKCDYLEENLKNEDLGLNITRPNDLNILINEFEIQMSNLRKENDDFKNEIRQSIAEILRKLN